jgi:hypothetical protein
VHEPEPAGTDRGLQRVQRRRHPARHRQVVPRRPGVAGVEADADQRVLVQRGQVGAEVLDGRAAVGLRKSNTSAPLIKERTCARQRGQFPRVNFSLTGRKPRAMIAVC